MRNETCVETQTSKVPTRVAFLLISILCLNHDFPDDVIEQLKNSVDPCQHSNDFGIDIYLRALDVMLALTGHQMQ